MEKGGIMSRGYGNIIYVDSIEEAKALIENRKNEPSLQELFEQRAIIDEKISVANLRLGFPDVIIVTGELSSNGN